MESNHVHTVYDLSRDDSYTAQARPARESSNIGLTRKQLLSVRPSAAARRYLSAYLLSEFSFARAHRGQQINGESVKSGAV